MSTTSQLPFEPPHDPAPSWKKEVNARLAAHRNRRTKQESEEPSAMSKRPAQPDSAASRAAQVAARVAARYANAPTYSELLANEARNAARAAAAAANAAREAHEAAQAILQGLDLEPEQPAVRQTSAAQPAARSARALEPEPLLSFEENRSFEQNGQSEHDEPRHAPAREAAPAVQQTVAAPAPPQIPEGPKTVVPPPDFTPRQTAPEALVPPRPMNAREEHPEAPAASFVEPVEPIPGNLIEFPRVLIAPQKARPRLAEGPLRETTATPAPEIGEAQLSIFEAETEHTVLVEPEPPVPTQSMVEWSSIELDAQPAQERMTHVSSKVLAELPLATATLEDRLMSGLVDMALVMLSFLCFVAVFVACTPHLPTGKFALVGAAITLMLFHLLYQYLFFTFAEGTPGMRYAHIALCTFDDENPTRKQMRKRIPTSMLSLAAVGLGFLWSLFDEDRLGWHDRLTRTYQRSYR